MGHPSTTRVGGRACLVVVVALALTALGAGEASAQAKPPPGSGALIGVWQWRDLDERLLRDPRGVRVRFVHRNGRVHAKFPESRASRVTWRPKGRRFAFAAVRRARVGSARTARVRVVYRGRVTRTAGRWRIRGVLQIGGPRTAKSAFTANKLVRRAPRPR